MSVTIGIDIAKLKFDVCILKPDGTTSHAEFDNNTSGFNNLCTLLKNDNEKYVALEATGIYGEPLCQYLHTKGHRIFLLNPVQTKYYAKSMMKRSKTDKCDAYIIAQFLNHHKNELMPWTPRSKSFNTIKNLYRCLQDINTDCRRIAGRIEACIHTDQAGRAEALKHYQNQRKFYDKQKETIFKQLRLLIQKDSDVKSHYDLLTRIPGIGEVTAIGLIANLPDISKFKCAKQLAAFAGLNPSVNESGSSVRGLRSISKTGSKNLRNVLFMPALVSKKCCKPMFNFAERIIKKGKRPKVAVVAVMHKLIRIIFAVLRKGEKFNESMI